MPHTIEAEISAEGNVRLLERVSLPGTRRAPVTVLDPTTDADSLALLSEAALADWNHEDEDAAWAHLQQEP